MRFMHFICINTDLGLRLRQQPNHTAYNIQDNSIVRLASLGTLLCTTPYQHCCQNRGHWHYPNGSIVPASQSGTLLFTSRIDQGLGLHQRTDFQETIPGVDGVYKCEIPDENGLTQALSAWIYNGPPCKLPDLLHLCYDVFVHFHVVGHVYLTLYLQLLYPERTQLHIYDVVAHFAYI